MKIEALKARFETRMLKEKNVARVVNFNEKFTTWQQRLVLGVASISTQPMFDYFNKNVDEDTRRYSTARTVAKILVGTSEGCLVRYLAIKHGKKVAFNWLRNPNVTGKLTVNLGNKIKTLKNKAASVESKLQHLNNDTKAYRKNEELKTYFNESIERFNEYRVNFTKWVNEFKDPKITYDPDIFKKNENLKGLNNFLNQAGGVISVVSAFGAALLIDIPMTNKALNWVMTKLFPDQNENGGSK